MSVFREREKRGGCSYGPTQRYVGGKKRKKDLKPRVKKKFKVLKYPLSAHG